MKVMCPYCKIPASLVGGRAIYPHRSDLWGLKFWVCTSCEAYTGTHANSPDHAPKGGLANAELRSARIAAHAAFDPRWKSGDMRRGDAYRWLQEKLGMTEQPHIGFMDLEQCARVIAACRE